MGQELDDKLLELLRNNSRESIANLARQLGVSRATIKEHMATLERRKVIEGYTVRIHPQNQHPAVSAYLMIDINPKRTGLIVRQIEKLLSVQSLYSISGSYDLLAQVSCDTTAQLDQVIDEISTLDGVEKTLTSVVLGAKFRR